MASLWSKLFTAIKLEYFSIKGRGCFPVKHLTSFVGWYLLVPHCEATCEVHYGNWCNLKGGTEDCTRGNDNYLELNIPDTWVTSWHHHVKSHIDWNAKSPPRFGDHWTLQAQPLVLEPVNSENTIHSESVQQLGLKWPEDCWRIWHSPQWHS